MCSSVAPRALGLPRSLEDLVPVHHVGPSFAQVGPKRAEIARVDADVGRVDVRVDVVVAEVAVVPLADEVGHRPEREQVVRRLERQAVLEAQSLPGLDLLADRTQSVCSVRHRSPVLCSHRGRSMHPSFWIDWMVLCLLSVILVRIERIINRTRLLRWNVVMGGITG